MYTENNTIFHLRYVLSVSVLFNDNFYKPYCIITKENSFFQYLSLYLQTTNSLLDKTFKA